MLRRVAETSSISQAKCDAGVSYKAVWHVITTLTELAEVPLVERAVGGIGGGTVLTENGERLLEMADALDAARREVYERWSAPGRRARQGSA